MTAPASERKDDKKCINMPVGYLIIFRKDMLLDEVDSPVEHDGPFLVVKVEHHGLVGVLSPRCELVLHHPISHTLLVTLRDDPGSHRCEIQGGHPEGHVQGVDELVHLVHFLQMVDVESAERQARLRTIALEPSKLRRSKQSSYEEKVGRVVLLDIPFEKNQMMCDGVVIRIWDII